MITNDTRISDLTVGELLQVIHTAMGAPDIRTTSLSTARGISGIAQIFGVSESTAKRIKASGVIDAAISQQGRVIVVDAEKARRLYGQAAKGRRHF